MKSTRKSQAPVCNGVRGPRVNRSRSEAEIRRELDYKSNQRIARAWAPDFEGQEKFGDDR